jgi:flagellar biogenesis protein FliO
MVKLLGLPMQLAAGGAYRAATDLLSVAGSLIGMVLIIVFTYYATRWYAGRMGKSAMGRYVRIIEKVPVGTGSSIIVAKAGEKYYLVGVGDKNVRLISVLEDFIPGPEQGAAQSAFGGLLRGVLRKAGNSKDDGAEQ